MQSAGKVWLDFLSSHSLGDTLAFISMDVVVSTLTNYPFYWVRYLGRSNVEVTELVEDNYVNEPLFQLYGKAGLFTNVVTLNLPQLFESRDRYETHLLRCIEITYNVKYNNIVWGRPKFELSPSAMPMYNELRSRFQFLEQQTPTPYCTVQFCSTINHCSHNYDFLPETKRMSFDKLVEHLSAATTKYSHTVKFIGNNSDELTIRACVAKLKKVMPHIRAEVRCGSTLEGAFRQLYNSSYHLAAESYSSFFTSQLGIPSTQVCLHPDIHNNQTTHNARANLENHYRYIETLTFDTDTVKVWGTNNKDLQ